MTPIAATFLLLACSLAFGAGIAVMVAWETTHRRGRGLPDHVRRVKVIGPALGNSLWVGDQPAGDVDVRRVS